MYARLVNLLRVRCPDGTVREPSPREVAAVVRSCARVSLDGSRPVSCPALRAAERAGDLDTSVLLARRLDRLGVVSHARRIVAETAAEIVFPTL